MFLSQCYDTDNSIFDVLSKDPKNMMNTFDAIEQRRSVKYYDAGHEMPDEDVKKLLNAALLTPTSFNIQNYRFVVIRDKNIQGKIKEASWDQAHVLDGSAVILVCANLKAAEQDPKKYWKLASTAVAEMMASMTLKFYEGNDHLNHDEALRSVGMAAQTIMLAAKAMNYETCPMIGFDPKRVGEIINLPKDHLIGMMIVVGKGTQPARERSGPMPYEQMVFENSF
jgi:nitroreductase